ncbi:MAG: ABC transporter ATP-binding protein [Faecousia sp.]|nr:ABC transporter ATP-binding protein [Bacillota bacterium]
MAILELSDIRYRYNTDKTQRAVLNGMSYAFACGTFYALVGKSGAGKSTLLSLMAGLDLPDSGEVRFEGVSTAGMNLDEYRRKKVSVIYQDFALFPLLTALENIMYPMELCHVPKQEAKQEALRLAERVSLPKTLLDRYPSHISGGEQQRVAIARGLTMDRRLLLADEPTGNLDSENSDIIIDLLAELAHEENRCVIVVTHDLSVMDRADVVCRIQDGKLEER